MADVINRTTLQYLQSINTPDYPDIDWIVNPDLSGLIGIPQKYWKIVGDTVVQMDTTEQAAVDASIANATSAIGTNYLTTTYNSTNQLITETWYRDRTGTGSYTTKVKETNYTYVGNSMTQAVTNYFSLGGTILSSQTTNYFTDLDSKVTYMENNL